MTNPGDRTILKHSNILFLGGTFVNNLNRAILILAASFILCVPAAAQLTGINSVFPLQNALHTPNDVIISVQFNSPIDLSTLNDSTFIVMGGGRSSTISSSNKTFQDYYRLNNFIRAKIILPIADYQIIAIL